MFNRLRSHLSLPVIISALPYNIQNGDSVDAVPVMADFNHIVSQVNANAQQLTTVALTAFTPTITFGGNAVGVTYAVQTGAYVRIGSIIFFAVDILLTNKGSSTGSAKVNGLPVAANAAWPTGGLASFGCAVGNLTFTENFVSAYIAPNNTTIGLTASVSGGAFNFVDNTYFNNNTEISVSGFYSA